jgi:type I restriction enzyme S subunit
MLLADSFQLAVKSNIHGGVNQNIHAEDIKDTFVCRPPLNEQQNISEFLNDVCAKYNLLIDNANNAIELMNERKTALISAAVTGKIDVRDWQEPTEQEG